MTGLLKDLRGNVSLKGQSCVLRPKALSSPNWNGASKEKSKDFLHWLVDHNSVLDGVMDGVEDEGSLQMRPSL